jgi:cell division protein FtsL
VQRAERWITPKRALVLGALVVLAVLALFYLWQSWQWVYWLNELHQAQAELDDLRAERDRLLFEVGRAFSLERIERIARETLGMYRPEPQYLELLPITP